MTDFATFFGELNSDQDGRHLVPHPWQRRLATRLAGGDPPRSISVPTGGGKTATLDALVWALAQQSGRRAHERTVGVRLIWAIDRRLLVDEVHRHAARMAERLVAALSVPDDPLHSIAAALGALTGGAGPPLLVSRWRGQVRVEPRAHHPLQPQVITSTVAQVGSRLLFRGFGVGQRSLALEAALCAVDTTICLDEAHLAEPFRQTADAIRAARAEQEQPDVLGGLSVMTLSATPTVAEAPDSVHATTPADDASLGSRLDAPKHVRLAVPDSEQDSVQIAALLDAAFGHIDQDGARRVACVVNTVRLAGLVAERGRKLRSDVTCVLLVGPQRPHDRRDLLEQHAAAIFERVPEEQPLLVVATQAIEVGLDADFDAIVTQSASATAIIQRLGRLNRAGLDVGHATVVRAPAIALYERDEPACWAWLERLQGADGVIDASPRALAAGGGPPADARVAFAPDLTRETIDLLQQTAPRPAPTADPAVEPFLRGIDEPPGDDVTLCWRGDLELERDDPPGARYREALLRLAPPLPEECIALGLRRFHAFAQARFGDRPQAARIATSAADVEGEAEASIGSELHADAVPRFVILRDGETLEVGVGQHTVRAVRPGDTVVLATQTGGYANRALAPDSAVPVDDVGNAVALFGATALPVGVRINPDPMKHEAAPALRVARRLAASPVAETGPGDWSALMGALCKSVPPERRFDVRCVTELPTVIDDPWDESDGVDDFATDGTLLEGECDDTLVDRFVCVLHPESRPDLVRSQTVLPPTLESHATAVAERAQAFAAGLAAEMADAVRVAARAHDHGKADDRFQAFFRGGVRAIGEEAIAKSLFGMDDRQASRRARERAGLPRGLRHEVASVAVLADHLDRERPPGGWPFDEALALHLVGTHHGLGRPWPRMPEGGLPAQDFAADAAGITGIAQGDGLDGWDAGAWLRRFFDLSARYGAWGLAYLEAVLVLADRTVSAEGA